MEAAKRGARPFAQNEARDPVVHPPKAELSTASTRTLRPPRLASQQCTSHVKGENSNGGQD